MRPDGFKIERVSGLDVLAERWRRLECAAPSSFFLSWRWISAWIAASGVEPLLLVGTAGERDATLGLLARARGVLGAKVVALNETGSETGDVAFIEYNGLLGATDDRGVIDSAARFLLDQRRDGPIAGWDELRLSAVPRAWAESFAAAGAEVTVRAEQRSFAIDLDRIRQSGGDALALMNANTRQQIRRARRLYHEAGGLRLERIDEARAQSEAMAELIELHQASWRARGEPGAFASPVFRRFTAELIAGDGRGGGIEILRVKAGTRTIGMLLNLVYGGDVANYQAAFVRESDNRLKPGLVTHALAIEHHLAAGARSYDLLAGAARYKESLGSPHREMLWLSVRPRSLRSRALAFAGRVQARLQRMRRSARSS